MTEWALTIAAPPGTPRARLPTSGPSWKFHRLFSAALASVPNPGSSECFTPLEVSTAIPMIFNASAVLGFGLSGNTNTIFGARDPARR